MYNEKLKNNLLITKKDVQEALLDILKPLEKYFSDSLYGIRIDSGGTVYEEKTREIEAVLRPLWGIIPLIAGGGEYDFTNEYILKIVDGVNPDNDCYWGEIHDTDQLMVEMAVLATGLILAKETFWDRLDEENKSNLHRWLIKINDHDMPENNWRFFRVLVNLAFKKCGENYSEVQMQKDLADIDSYYLDNGWYSDGLNDQIDYYTPFAIHYYSLIYVKVVGDEDPIYAPKFKERAMTFAKDFKHYFNADGQAIPYGRSMAYRFAQSAFWGALAFADAQSLPWGEVKFLALENLRHWFKQDVFSPSGELTIGYHYRNLVMAEGYNAYGSPYWALKAFIFLALDESHPFWTTDAVAPIVDKHLLIKEARSIIGRDLENEEVQMFPVGQHCGFMPAHSEAKYEKFVYSTTFGFSVSKGTLGLSQGAFDNTLAVSEQDKYYRMRYDSSTYTVCDDFVHATWRPWENVEIKSYIIPFVPWHVRIHFIKTDRKLSLADGGFAINTEGGLNEIIDHLESACVRDDNEISGMVNLANFEKQEFIYSEPNTNLNVARAVIPTLCANIDPGIYVFASAFLGARKITYWDSQPEIRIENGKYIVTYLDKEVVIKP